MLALTVLIVDSRQDGPLMLGLIFMAGGLGAFLGAGISAVSYTHLTLPTTPYV